MNKFFYRCRLGVAILIFAAVWFSVLGTIILDAMEHHIP